jgi:nicotinate-nucleotide adenylyltransferase
MLAVYGGSFDPPHAGHTQILKYLAENTAITKVLVVPTFQNPLKENFHEDSKEFRKKLIQAWQEDLHSLVKEDATKKIEFSFIEFENTAPSYTVETLQKIKQKYPNIPIVLALGEDNLETLLKWKNPEGMLATLHSLWIFPRHNSKIEVSKFPPQLRPFCPIRWTAHEVVSISSTEIRNSLKMGANLAKELVSPRVRDLLLQE